MANITPTIKRVIGQNGVDGYQVQWTPMQNGDVGLAVGSTIGDGSSAVVPSQGGSFAGFADKSIQASGTFGAGGSVACEGTNEGTTTNFFPLTNPSGTTIALTAASGSAVTEAVIWVRPHVTAGDSSTSLTVTMFFRKTQEP